MKSQKIINELLHYLYSEREKMESTGCNVDFDLRKAHRFINKEIQDLQMLSWEQEYTQFSERLSELFEASSGSTKQEKGNAV